MNSSTLTLTPEHDKNICEGLKCNEQATLKATVNVGQLGTVDLNLCRNCIMRFTEVNHERKQQVAI